MGFQYCNLNDVKMWLAGVDMSEMPSTIDLLIEQNYIPWAKRQIDTYIGENLDSTTVTEHYDGSGMVELILRHRPISYLRKCVLRIIPSMQWFEFMRWTHINNVDQTGIKVASHGGVTPLTMGALPPYVFSVNDDVPEDLKGPVPTAVFSDTTAQYEGSDLFVNCRQGILSIPPRIMYLENQAIPFWNYTWLRGYGNIEVSYDYGYKTQADLPQEIRSACAQFVAAAILSTKGQFMGAGAMSFTLGQIPRSYGDQPYSAHIKAYQEGAKMALASYRRLKV